MSAEIHPLWYLVLAVVLSLIPLLVGLTTSYVKISVIMSLLRSGLGTAQAPGALVVMAITIALSGYIMEPVIEQVSSNLSEVKLIQKLQKTNTFPVKEISYVVLPWKEFLFKHSGKKEITFLLKIRQKALLKKEKTKKSTAEENKEAAAKIENKIEKGKKQKKKREKNLIPHPQDLTVENTPFFILLPAFLITELKEAFTMAFVLLLPFLVIDIVVANILVGLGMYMVSPVLISLPLKLAVFVLADGWLVLCKGIVMSYVN